MKKRRKIQILSIVALVIAIAGMSIGFAVFSVTLSISSSATVTPNSNDFKMKMYGLTDETIPDKLFDANFTDENSARIFVSDYSGEFIAANKYATLNNSNMTISTNFTEVNNPNDSALYIVKIVNEGKHDAYIDISSISSFGIDEDGIVFFPTNCVPGEGTSAELVASACDGFFMLISIYSPTLIEATRKLNYGEITNEEYNEIQINDCVTQGGVCEIKPNEYILYVSAIAMSEEDYNENKVLLADGPFDVYFPDVKLDFTTSSTGRVNE